MYLCVSVVICRWRSTNSAGKAELERLFIRFSLELICQLAGYTNYWDGDINVILSNIINSFLTLSEPEVAYMLLLSSNSKWPIQTKKNISPHPTPLNTKQHNSRRRHGDSRRRCTVAGRTVDAWWLGKLLFTACVISIAAWLCRDRLIIFFPVVEIEFFPLFVGNGLAFSTAEITTEQTTATEVAASYDAAEHEQRLFK